MNLMKMSFKNFVWRNNPTSLNVSAGKNIKEKVLPFSGSKLQNLGSQKRKVTGEGYFVGEDCMEQWQSLQRVYGESGAGCLRLPNQPPFLAVMDTLKMIGVSGKNLIKYSFSFTESDSAAEYDGTGMHTATLGETLWDYACRFGRDIDEIVSANPNIRDIMNLSSGECVEIPPQGI